MENYFHVLTSLGLDKDILKLAFDNELGRKLQNAALGNPGTGLKRGMVPTASIDLPQ